MRLDGTKSTPIGDIPAGMLKPAIDIHTSILLNIMNSSFRNRCSLDDVKAAEVNTIFKKNGTWDKENYRYVSVLSHTSKVFESIMYIQIESFMEDKLPKLLTGFRKNYNTLHCLSNILEKWKNTFDKSGFVCAMFMDLSKDFDTKKQNLLITKSGAYGFLKDALSFMKSYLFNEKIARSLCK